MEPKLARPLLRLKAFAWDYLLILGYALCLGLFTLIPTVNRAAQILFANPVRSDISAFFLLILPVILYFSLTESSPYRATWGKRRVGIQVSGALHDLGLMRALIRSSVKFLPWQLGHTAIFQLQSTAQPSSQFVWILMGLVYGLVGLYCIMLWLSPKYRTPYDLVADTIVIL